MAACSMDKLISVTQVRGARQCADGWLGVEMLHEISPHSIVQTMILVRHNGWGIEGLHSFRARLVFCRCAPRHPGPGVCRLHVCGARGHRWCPRRSHTCGFDSRSPQGPTHLRAKHYSIRELRARVFQQPQLGVNLDRTASLEARRPTRLR